jgi:hypothetical protein
MSAQIIGALRSRAKALDAEAMRLTEMRAAQPGLRTTEDPAALFRFAREFRALADAAEGREPS